MWWMCLEANHYYYHCPAGRYLDQCLLFCLVPQDYTDASLVTYCCGLPSVPQQMLTLSGRWQVWRFFFFSWTSQFSNPESPRYCGSKQLDCTSKQQYLILKVFLSSPGDGAWRVGTDIWMKVSLLWPAMPVQPETKAWAMKTTFKLCGHFWVRAYRFDFARGTGHKHSRCKQKKICNNEPFSTAERSERVENFLFRATREYAEAGIEQAIVAMWRLGANSPEPRKRVVREWHVSTQKTGSYITERSRLPGLIVGPCPSEESLCCPACPPAAPLFFADSRPPVYKVSVLFPCICSPTVCIIRSITSLSLATTTWTPEHPFSRLTAIRAHPPISHVSLGEAPSHGFSSKGVAAVRARRLFPSTISGVRAQFPSYLWVEN